MSEYDDTPVPPPTTPPVSRGWEPIVPLGGMPLASDAASGTQPTLTQPASNRGSSGGPMRVMAGVLGVLGGLMIVAGSFLDWVRADIVGEGIVFASGWANVSGSVADGPMIAALGALVVVWGAVTLAGPITGRWVIAGFVASGSATAVVVYELIDLTTPGPGIQTELRAGVWVMVAGCAVGLIAGLVALVSVRGASRSLR